MSEFYDKARPLIERAVANTERVYNRVIGNDGFVAWQIYNLKQRLELVAYELGATKDGTQVPLDTRLVVNREDFINHLHLLAGESPDTVWVDESTEPEQK